MDWVYSCATGVAMVFGPEFEYDNTRTYTTCNSFDYPATCYRFMKSSFYQVGPTACDNITDLYHKNGCVWGYGFLIPEHHAFVNADPECSVFEEEHLYLSCMDGYYHNTHWQGIVPEKQSCFVLNNQAAKELCLAYINMDRSYFNIAKTPWFRLGEFHESMRNE